MITKSSPFGFIFISFFMNRFQRKQFLKQANLLELVPVRVNDHVEESDGRLSILVPKFKNSVLSKVFIPSSKSKDIKVRLDRIGSQVWQSIDGIRTVSELYLDVAQNMEQHTADLEDRVHRFVLSLYDQRFITFTALQD